MLEIGGAYFPAWLLAMVCGLAGASLARIAFAALGLDAVLQPRALVYPAIGLFLTLAVYLLFFAP